MSHKVGAPAARALRPDAGAMLAETLVAILLLALLVGGAAGVLSMQTKTANAQPEVVDLQQRVRYALETIGMALRRAGAGLDAGPDAGPLRGYFAPVLPRRIGAWAADPFSVARADAIAILTVPGTSVQTALRDPVTSAADGITAVAVPTCMPSDPICGIRVGMPLVMFDRRARFELMTVTAVAGDRATVRLWHAPPGFDYVAGAALARVDASVFYLDPVARQIRQSDGDGSDLPLVDNAAGLTFEYFGDAEPPDAPQPPLGIANCLYDELGARVPLTSLPPGGAALVPLPLGMLADGPWCGAGGLRFDADLLRVRLIRVTVRLQTAGVMRRGSGADYAAPGLGKDALTLVPDFSASIDVAPRNLQGRLR